MKEYMNQILMQERKSFEGRIGQINHAHDIIERNRNKINNYLLKKQTEPRLLTSEQTYNFEDAISVPKQPRKQSKDNTFKLFTKNKKQEAHEEQDINQTKPNLNLQSRRNGKGSKTVLERINVLEEVEAMQKLIRKKLSIKQEKILELEREIKMQNQEKVHLYKLNSQLEEELAGLQLKSKNEQIEEQKQIQILEKELKRISKQYEQRKSENKQLKRQYQALKETLKNLHKSRKQFIEKDLKQYSSKSQIIKTSNDDHEEQYLRNLVDELDRLKNLVKSKMKKTTSRGRLR